MFRTVFCTVTENLILTPKTKYTVVTIRCYTLSEDFLTLRHCMLFTYFIFVIACVMIRHRATPHDSSLSSDKAAGPKYCVYFLLASRHQSNPLVTK